MTPYTTLWHCLCSHLCPLKVLMPGRNLIESEGDSPVSPVEMRVALPSRNKSGENFQSALVFRPFQLAISLFRGAFSRIVSHWMTAMELMSGRKLFPSGKASHQYLSSAFCGNPLGKSINCKDRPSLQDVRLDFRRGYEEEEEEEKQQWESGLEDGDSDLEDTSDWLEGDSEDDCYSSDSEDELDLDSDCDWEIQPVVFKVCASPVEKESFLNKGQNSQSDLQATEHEDKVEEDEDDDSDWSDNSEESDWDDDSETNGDSKRNLELWESFFHSDDPYNPLGFSAPCRMGQDSRVEKTEMGTETPELRLETEGAKVEDDKVEPRECKHKKVRFSPVVQVHHLPECAFDDHAARSGACWEEMARDRLRFQRRVQQISEQIDCCLQSEHRERVWKRLQ